MSNKLFLLSFKLLMILFLPVLVLMTFVISRPLNNRVEEVMNKYGREDIVKILLMSGLTGLIRILFSL
jgi:ABC-type bacteriocin/lantibiotic exporter with double-glycine peptidase domain